MTDPIAYRLKNPITITSIEGKVLDELSVSEMTIRSDVRARDLQAMDDATGEVGKTLALIAKLSGLTKRQVDELGVADFAAIGEIVAGFMPPGLLTGGTA